MTPAPSIATASEPVTQAASPFVAMSHTHRFGVVCVMAIALVGIGLRLQLSPPNIAGMQWVYLALVGNAVLLLLPVIFYRPSFGWFHPLVFAIFWGVLPHLRRFDVYFTGLPWHVALPGWSADSLTGLLLKDLLLQMVGTLAIYAGFWLSPTLPMPSMPFQQPAHLGRKTVATVGLATGLFLVYMQTRGGIVNHLLSWGAGRNEALAGVFYWQFFTQLGQIACLCWLTMDRRSTRNPVFWGCLTASLMMAFLIGGSRSGLIYFMAMCLLAWFIREQKIAVMRMVAIALIGLVAMGVLGNLRNSTFSGQINWNTLRGGAAETTSETRSPLGESLQEISERSSVNAGVFPILALVPNQVEHLYGSSYLAILTLPIPRALWSAKPGLVAGMVGETFFSSNFGIPPGAVGEAYWNFGVPGVLVVFSAFGAFLKLLADFFVRHAHHPAAIAPYVVTLFLFAGPDGLATIAWLMMLVPTLGYLIAIGAIRFSRSA
ncbi:O-antigen polymerase [Halomicronema sp. CCY15110]|uniref:O-antigen polymerase n=1 Tax=Halomicronema sp. CCY15110 TaxID=2767773 RepID=UPI00194EBE3B|nr:O-antigen polymerase [Halomicronema sp. CCY15110]